MDYTEQITYLLFLKMAWEQLASQKNPVALYVGCLEEYRRQCQETWRDIIKGYAS